MTLPFNAIPVADADGNVLDHTGRRVLVNSVGGPSWPDNRTGKKVIQNWDHNAKYPNDPWKRALENVQGSVVWGPAKLRYNAKTKVGEDKKTGKPILKEKTFVTNPYWNVLLDGYNLEICFVERELTFL